MDLFLFWSVDHRLLVPLRELARRMPSGSWRWSIVHAWSSPGQHRRAIYPWLSSVPRTCASRASIFTSSFTIRRHTEDDRGDAHGCNRSPVCRN